MRRPRLILFALCLLLPLLLIGWPIPMIMPVNSWFQQGLREEGGFVAFIFTWVSMFVAYITAVYLAVEGACATYRRVGQAAHSVRHLLG